MDEYAWRENMRHDLGTVLAAQQIKAGVVVDAGTGSAWWSRPP